MGLMLGGRKDEGIGRGVRGRAAATGRAPEGKGTELLAWVNLYRVAPGQMPAAILPGAGGLMGRPGRAAALPLAQTAGLCSCSP